MCRRTGDMQVIETSIPGCYKIQAEVRNDPRGSFVKIVHAGIFKSCGLNWDFVEQYYTVSRRGVIRGMHFQLPPFDHHKLVYCASGNALDAVVDLRVGSSTCGKHISVELSGENGMALYIPPGLAHGFCAITEHATMVYNVTSCYSAESDCGILWSSAGIDWPVETPILSPRDSALPKLSDFRSPFRMHDPEIETLTR